MIALAYFSVTRWVRQGGHVYREKSSGNDPASRKQPQSSSGLPDIWRNIFVRDRSRGHFYGHRSRLYVRIHIYTRRPCLYATANSPLHVFLSIQARNDKTGRKEERKKRIISLFCKGNDLEATSVYLPYNCHVYFCSSLINSLLKDILCYFADGGSN